MINNRRILAVIPARGGSKGIPRKNIKEIAGKPLIAWTIEAAKKSVYIDRVILSSEDDEIIEVAKLYGCDVPFKRPENLAQDNTHGIEPILHALEFCQDYDYVMMLQPTSPLRLTEDIDRFIEHTFEKEAVSCVSISEPAKSPYWMYKFDSSNQLKPILPEHALIPRRQDLPSVYALNGALYIAKVEWLRQNKNFMSPLTKGYEMPANRSFDIDTLEDFMICEMFLKLNH